MFRLAFPSAAKKPDPCKVLTTAQITDQFGGTVSPGVKGLTTAATVWVVAALGMSVGFGLYIIATAGAVIVLIGLILVRPLEIRFLRPPHHPMRRRDDEVPDLPNGPV